MTPTSIEELLGDTAWLRRLARHLAGDEGDDVVHDAWLAARRSPPDAARPARPWLAQVLRNLVHSRHRDDARRARRERDFQAHLAPSGTVDEAYERLELVRLLGERVAALEEPLRAVVTLRYFEGLDSARIAAVTGTPPGTVRWRLKLALERLRADLDERHGKRWVVLLAPRPPRATGALAMATIKTTLGIAAGLLVLLLAASLGWLRRGGPTAEPRAAAADAGASALLPGVAPSRAGGPPRIALARDLPPSTDLAGCELALGQARDEADAREREARALVPEVAYAAGAPNARLREEILPQLERLLGPGAPAHHVECRAWACRVAVVVPNDGGGEVQPLLDGLLTWLPHLIEGLPTVRPGGPAPLGVVQQWGGGAPRDDVLARRKLEELVFLIGAPPGALDADTRVAGPPPRSLDECRAALAASRATTRRLELELAGFQPPPAAFAAATPVPAQTARVQAAADHALGAGAARVECRGTLCRLTFPRPPDATTLARLGHEPDLHTAVINAREIEAALYLPIRESAWAVLHRLRAPMHTPGFFAACPPPPAAGGLLLRLTIPATGDLNDLGAPGQAAARVLGGTLAGTPAAACLVERLNGLLSAALPAPIDGALRFETWTWRPGEEPLLSTPE